MRGSKLPSASAVSRVAENYVDSALMCLQRGLDVDAQFIPPTERQDRIQPMKAKTMTAVIDCGSQARRTCRTFGRTRCQ